MPQVAARGQSAWEAPRRRSGSPGCLRLRSHSHSLPQLPAPDSGSRAAAGRSAPTALTPWPLTACGRRRPGPGDLAAPWKAAPCPPTGCATPSTACGSPAGSRPPSRSSRSASSLPSWPASTPRLGSPGDGADGAPAAVVDALRSRRGGRRPSRGAPAREGPEPARSSLPAVGPVGARGGGAARGSGSDVAQVCRLARAMRVPVAEMQRSYALFRDHAEPLAAGAELLKDGRIGQEQFARLARRSLISDGEALPSLSVIRRVKLSIERVLDAAEVSQDRSLSFGEFLECMRLLTFDEAFCITPEESELRRLAKKYNVSLFEVERCKIMFDELDENRSGRIRKQEFDKVLCRCGNIPRDIGLSASRRHSLWLLADSNLDGSIDFEEFLIFNVNYVAPGAEGFADYYRR